MPLPTVTIFGSINKLETRFSQSGTQITSFQIECSEKNKNSEWENLYIKGAVFGKSAEFVNNYFREGELCVATGKLVTEVFEGQDGKKRYEIKLKFPQIEFAPKAKSAEKGEYKMPEPVYEKNPIPENNLPEIDINEDEIPFQENNMDMKIIISLIAMIAFVVVCQTTKYWLGTKFGDVMVALLGISAAYGFIAGSVALYEWIIK